MLTWTFNTQRATESSSVLHLGVNETKKILRMEITTDINTRIEDVRCLCSEITWGQQAKISNITRALDDLVLLVKKEDCQLSLLV